MLDRNLQNRVMAVARCATNRPQAVNYFRVALGLVYLDSIMTERKLDFKKIDRDYNQFIYRSIGGGHSITSILQYMSGAKVLPVLESEPFLLAFEQNCSEVPLAKVPILLSVNLGVAKDISGLSCEGPVRDWLSWRAREAAGGKLLEGALSEDASLNEPAPADAVPGHVTGDGK